MLDRIWIGVDGPDHARRATAAGLAIAASADATVDVVHVTSDGGANDGDDAAPVFDDLTALLEDASVPVETHALPGDPRTASWPSPTIGTPTSTCSDAGETRASASDCSGPGPRGAPTVRSPRPDGSGGRGAFDISELLVPTDGSDVAERAAPLAATNSAQHGATVHLLRSRPGDGGRGVQRRRGYRDGDRALRGERPGSTRRVRRPAPERHPELSIRSDVEKDEPHAALAEDAETNGVDLVVISTQGEGSALGQALWSVTDRLLGSVPVPVLIVRGDGER